MMMTTQLFWGGLMISTRPRHDCHDRPFPHLSPTFRTRPLLWTKTASFIITLYFACSSHAQQKELSFRSNKRSHVLHLHCAHRMFIVNDQFRLSGITVSGVSRSYDADGFARTLSVMSLILKLIRNIVRVFSVSDQYVLG